MQMQALKYAGFFVGGVALGATAAYFITRDRLANKFFEQAEEEIREVKKTYDMLRHEDIVEGSEEDRKRTHDFLDKLDNLQYGQRNLDMENLEAQIDAAFENEENFDAQREEGDDPRTWARTQDAPYVIAVEEYMEDADEYEKLVLTYFEADNTLIDETDSIVPDIEANIGVANLLNFGAGSKDKNTLYVRNDKMRNDYEVIRNEGSYSAVVLGIKEWSTDDVREKKIVRKMRDGS